MPSHKEISSNDIDWPLIFRDMITPNTNEYHKNGHELGCRQKGCDQGIK